MPGRSVLKWTTLAIISILVVLALLSISHREAASAATQNVQPETQGSLRILDQNGSLSGECPLKHTTVKAEVSGFISRVTVRQEFENNKPDKIEAVYSFPLPQAAAVDDLTMVIGERTIKGKIMRREEAQAAYTQAKQEGKIASLLDQERPNIFTQQVANIMPGQQITVTISYVETLKYEDGAYEWSFPMVVAARYIPKDNPGDDQREHAGVSPRVADGTMRSGHDISIELDLNAGLPITSVNSESHETEVQQIDDRRTLVRLKDLTTIPNKDFVLTYRVAGDTINDAVLTHRTDRGGFFTLILQPPQRVAPEDVMPKELVFVLDTSGSMEGFPLAKAKQTMNLALSNLYPHDTFNLITFAGETKVLFPQPVPATPENLRRAKRFLSSSESDGGTEMMDAVRAALEPSDSQGHVRIVCFMTDGLVGNDMQVIAEVQKHPNARVFAMGFGDSPNRFLLDRIALYGRGEVDYVLEKGDTSAVARRFHERVRNPLLTDLSIDWSNLPVTEVYPKRIPDLFSAKPVTLLGRYTSAAVGTIRLKGKMAGQDFVREIQVTLPEAEANNDVLGTLWARHKVDDLTRQETAAFHDIITQQQQREEITKLGLEFKLMTHYTSFVAIDDLTYTGRGTPQSGEVTESASTLVVNGSTASSCVMVSVSSLVIGTVSAVQNLPLQGRSFQSLVYLSPGASSTQNSASRSGISLNGQRTTANGFEIDGVSANFGIAAGGENPGASASGNTPALTASGGTNGIASLGAIQELKVESSNLKAEQGRVSGAQIDVTTRGGTNEFHGSAFYAFGNDAFDASDWFANSRNLLQPSKSLNMFGVAVGGPIKRDRTFFFATYEGMRLRQPVVGITDVPSISARLAAPVALRSFFDAFPSPAGATRPDGFAEFAASFANPAQHGLGSLRLDQSIGDNTLLRGRYSLTDSDASQRGASGSSLNTTNLIRSRLQTVTGSWYQTLSDVMVTELRVNYSRSRVSGSYGLDEFGGAAVPQNPFPSSSFAFDLNSRHARLLAGEETASIQRQFNLVASSSRAVGNHTVKFGSDYRRLSPIIGQRALEKKALFDGVSQALTGVAARFSSVNHASPQNPVYKNLSLFAQDDWRTTRLTFSYGMRWDVAPAPASNGTPPFAVDQINDPAELTIAAADVPLWKTTFTNLAPRASLAYLITDTSDELLLRAGVGVVYDVSQDRSGDAFANSIPFVSGTSVFNSAFPILAAPATNTFPFMAFDPRLRLPYTINWNISLQRYVASRQRLSAAYVGSSGKRLLHTETRFDSNPNFAFLRLVTNRARSDYRALQVKYETAFNSGFNAAASYTWGQSRDNVSDDSPLRVLMTSLAPALDRGPSDFDVRHQVTGYISYELPAPMAHGLGNKLSRNWTLDSIFNARSARPLNVLYSFPTSLGLAYLRPDLVTGASFYVDDVNAPAGRRLNAAAFLIPANLQQGNLGRNSLRGFPFYQFDLSLHRNFRFTDMIELHIQADAFNLLNHTNFEDPSGTDLVTGSSFNPTGAPSANAAFGQSTSLSGRSASSGGFGSFYSFGGARTMRFSVRFVF